MTSLLSPVLRGWSCWWPRWLWWPCRPGRCRTEGSCRHRAEPRQQYWRFRPDKCRTLGPDLTHRLGYQTEQPHPVQPFVAWRSAHWDRCRGQARPQLQCTGCCCSQWRTGTPGRQSSGRNRVTLLHRGSVGYLESSPAAGGCSWCCSGCCPETLQLSLHPGFEPRPRPHYPPPFQGTRIEVYWSCSSANLNWEDKYLFNKRI